MSDFVYFSLTGQDAPKFLQGQVTANIHDLGEGFTPSAICNLKGRVAFGLWLRSTDDGFGIVLVADLADAFTQHIKKYGAFSKIALSTPTPIYPSIIDNHPSFNLSYEQAATWQDWAQLSIAEGNYWLTTATQNLHQPQALRLHQRGGVAYDKGCYLGQEIVARLYFKSSPKAYLHRVATTTPDLFTEQADTLENISIINAVSTENGQEALIIARPEHICHHNLQLLDLPPALQADIGRP